MMKFSFIVQSSTQNQVNSEGLQRLEQDDEVDFVAEKQEEAASSE